MGTEEEELNSKRQSRSSRSRSGGITFVIIFVFCYVTFHLVLCWMSRLHLYLLRAGLDRVGVVALSYNEECMTLF